MTTTEISGPRSIQLVRFIAGEPIAFVSEVLDHSSLAVTTLYLRRLEGQTDERWGRVAEAIGL